MQVINNWLNGKKNFLLGAAIYKRFGNNQAFKNLLDRGETTFTAKLLCEELQKLWAPGEKTPAIKMVVSNAFGKSLKQLQTDVAKLANDLRSTPQESPEFVTRMKDYAGAAMQLKKVVDIVQECDASEVRPDSDDSVLVALKNEWHPLYQRMNLLRHQLDKYGNDNGWEAVAYRKERAKEIKSLEQQCMQIWAKRDHYKKEGKLPFVQENTLVIPTEPVELAKMINNMKKYIRRYRKQMNDHPGEPRYAQLYEQYKKQHKEVTGTDYEEKN